MQGRDYLDRILAFGDAHPTDSPFLNAIAQLAFDKHDVDGMLYLANEALYNLDVDDPYYGTFSRIVAMSPRPTRPYERHGKDILAICEDALERTRMPSLGR